MLRFAVAAVVLVGCIALAAPAYGSVSMRSADALGSSCTFVPTTGDWNSAVNWSCGHIPTTSDQVSIGGGQTAQIGAAAHAGDLTLAGGIIQFTANVGLDVTAVAAQSNGVLSVTSGSITGPGTVTVGGHFSKTTAGQLSVTSATLTLDDPAPPGSEVTGGDICLNSSTAVLHLTTAFGVATGADTDVFNCSAGRIQVDAGAEIDKTATGTVTFNTPLDNQGVVRNESGTLNLNGGSVATDNGTYTADNGTALVLNAGNFTIAGSLGGAGTVQVGTNVTLGAAATFTPGALHQTSGQLTVNGSSNLSLPSYTLDAGTLSSSRNVTATSFAVQSGVLDGGLTLTAASFSKSTAGQLTINNATLLPQSDVTIAAGNICLNSGTALLHLQHLLTIATGADTNVFNCSAGRIRIDQTAEIDKTATGTITINTPLDNQGTVRNETGTLNLNGGSVTTDNGTYTADAGTTLVFNAGTYTIAGSVAGAGTTQVGANVALTAAATFTPAALHQTNGALTINGSSALSLPSYSLDAGTLSSTRNVTATSFNVQSGTLDGGLTLAAGSFTKTTAGQLTINNATLEPDSDVTFAAGNICLNSGTALLHLQHLLTIATGADANAFNCSAGHIRLDQTAEMDKTATGTITINTPLDNQGTVRDEAGTLNLNGGSVATDNGTYTADNGTTLDFNAGVYTIAGSLGGAGTTQINTNVTVGAAATFTPATLHQTGGSLTVQGTSAASVGTYNLDSGTLSSSRNVTATALNVQSGTVSGAFALAVPPGGSFAKTTGGQLTMQSAMTLLIGVDATLAAGNICTTGTSVLELPHDFTIGAGADPSAFGCSAGGIQIDSTGRLDTTSAAPVTIQTPVQSAGTIAVAAGQTLVLNGGLTQTAGATTVAAGGTLGGFTALHVSGGTLTANGTVNDTVTLTGGGALNGGGQTGSVVNTSGTVAPGTSPGTLTVAGDYTQGAGGTLTEEIAGTTPGTQFDRLVVGGNVALDGTLAIQSGGFTPGASDTFKIVGGASSRSGTFATVTGTSVPPNNYTVRYDADGVTLLVNGTPPANTTPPSIPASGHPGDQITCDPGTWTGSPTFTFAWTRDGSAIGGQTASTYTLVDADVGHNVRCSVTGHNAGGDSAPVDSNALVATFAAPANSAPPSIPSSGHTGDFVTCNPGTWTGSPTFTYTWSRDGSAIAGQTAQAYTLTDADAGHIIRCSVTAHNAAGDTGPVDSNALNATVAAPANTAGPSIPGSGHTGDVITCNPGAWTGSPTFTYAWTRDGAAIAGQTAQTYTLIDADAGHAIRCSVTAHNAGGNAGPVDSNVLNAAVLAPTNTGAPTIPSSGHTGDVITCNPGGWTGSPTFTFAWTRDGTVIGGQTAARYTLVDADAGHAVRCRVTAHNGGGDAGPVDSNALGATVAVAKNTAAPSIPDTGRPGDIVTCNPGTWTGSPTFTYAWLRNDVALAGRTVRTYTLTSADVSQQIKCRVTAHNGGGDSAPADSNALAVVKASAAGQCLICILGAASHTNLTASGSGSIAARGGGISINGKARVSGKGKITATNIGMFPRASKASNFSPKPVSLKHAVADPFASRPTPAVTTACRAIPHSTTNVTLQPGVYCGLDRQKKQVTLEPGLYVFTGAIHLGEKATLSGKGVTIYLEGRRGSLALSSRAVLDVTAPTSGPYRGLAVYFDRFGNGSFELSGGTSAAVNGGVYGAHASVHLSGDAALTVDGSTLAVASLARSGSSRLLVRSGV